MKLRQELKNIKVFLQGRLIRIYFKSFDFGGMIPAEKKIDKDELEITFLSNWANIK